MEKLNSGLLKWLAVFRKKLQEVREKH